MQRETSREMPLKLANFRSRCGQLCKYGQRVIGKVHIIYLSNKTALSHFILQKCMLYLLDASVLQY